LVHTGFGTFFNHARRLYAGIGASEDETTYDIPLGLLEGSGGERMNIPYTVTAVIPVTEGSVTFYATGHGDELFDFDVVSMTATSFTGIFFPLQY
jgi:hypothetical protein